MTIDMAIEGANDTINMEIASDNLKDMTIEEKIVKGGTTNYEKLNNLPTLDGEPIVGEMHEKDPTVPLWAKAPQKPTYTAEELGCISEDAEMSLQEINEMCDMILND